MSSLGGIIGSDKWTLSDNMSIAVTFLIENDDDISRVANCFHNGDRVQAFSDIMQKGLQEFLDMCDMDEHLAEETENMKKTQNIMKEMLNIPPGKGGSI